MGFPWACRTCDMASTIVVMNGEHKCSGQYNAVIIVYDPQIVQYTRGITTRCSGGREVHLSWVLSMPLAAPLNAGVRHLRTPLLQCSVAAALVRPSAHRWVLPRCSEPAMLRQAV